MDAVAGVVSRKGLDMTENETIEIIGNIPIDGKDIGVI